MKKSLQKMLLATAVASLCLSGCATRAVLKAGEPATYTEKEKQVLVEDSVVAFARPATATANVPSHSIVILGHKYSYVLTSGGQELMNAIGQLDPRYLSVQNGLDFNSENDGHFSGGLYLKYRKLKSAFTPTETKFIAQNAVECTTAEDRSTKNQSFCFTISLKGTFYPVMNLAQAQYFSKSYPITIYGTKTVTKRNPGHGKTVANKLILLPAAVAFDVVTLPIQAFKDLFEF